MFYWLMTGGHLNFNKLVYSLDLGRGVAELTIGKLKGGSPVDFRYVKLNNNNVPLVEHKKNFNRKNQLR